ncbi:hypothetical protein AK830_g8237 [Neonectria ditissima]|uniref:Enoyl reductase (ER) domain-containing protein n=1 Tax=Neonectria ditissima TaxID=78410 RepID=A0A0P7BEP7_9HYPO|nr:hypothetical protein AK830_g8237 [Neonectria ditissima]
MTEPALPSTMKAWMFHTASGGAEKHMKLETLSLPGQLLPPNAALIKVQLVGLNPVDIKFAETPYIGHLLHSMPAIPGLDGVGRVVKTTDISLQIGQLIMFRLLEKQAQGALAEYIVAPSESCVPLPEGVLPVQAATVGTCGTTACQAIAPFVKEHRSQKRKEPFSVFINGGSGGTGTFQIQVAKALGCYVATSCSTSNVELCKSLGADTVIDYRSNTTSEALANMVLNKSIPPFDLVVDNVDLPWRLYKAAASYMSPGGTYVQVGGDLSWQSITELMRIKLLPSFLGGGKRWWMFLAMKTNREDGERILNWMQDGKIRTPIEAEFDFHDVPHAYERLKAGGTRGKIVVRVSKEE